MEREAHPTVKTTCLSKAEREPSPEGCSLNLDKHSRVSHTGTSVSCHVGWYLGNCKSVSGFNSCCQARVTSRYSLHLHGMDSRSLCVMWGKSGSYLWHMSLKGFRQTQLRVRMWSFQWLVAKGKEVHKKRLWGSEGATSVSTDSCGRKPLCAAPLGSHGLLVPVWHCTEVALPKED